MSGKKRPFNGFTLFLLLAALVIALGVFLIIYGASTNGVPVPKVPRNNSFALLGYMRHG